MSQATLALHAPEAAPEPEPARDGGAGLARHRLIAVAIVSLLIAVWFAPAFVARTGLRHRLVHAVVPAFSGTVQVNQAKLGWLSPVVLNDLQLSDTDNVELLKVVEFRTSQTLFGLLVDRTNDLGTLTIVRPTLSVRLRADGSNLEDTLNDLMQGAGSSSKVSVVISGGRVQWTNIDGSEAAGSLTGITATISRGRDELSPKLHEFQSTLTDGEHAGVINLRSSVERGREAISVIGSDLPLGALQPWLDRSGITVIAAGTLAGDVVIQPPAVADATLKIDGRISGRRLRFESAGTSDFQPLLIEELVVAGSAASKDSSLSFDDVELRSDLGNATINGHLNLDRIRAQHDVSNLADWLSQDLSLKGTLDLARLATIVPPSVRPTQPLRSGTLSFMAAASGEKQQRQGTLQFNVSDLTGGTIEQPLVWRKPLQFELAVRQTANVLHVDRAFAEAEFLKLQGSGSENAVQLDFQFDLDTFREKLKSVVSIAAQHLSGRVRGTLNIERLEGQRRFQVAAAGSVEDIRLAWSGRQIIEPEASVDAKAICQVDENNVTTVESGDATFRCASGDLLQATLSKSTRLHDNADLQATVTAEGSVKRWCQRANAMSVLSGEWPIDGSLTASSEVRWNENRLQLTKLEAEIAGFQWRSPAQTFDETFLRLTGDARWDSETGDVFISTGRLSAESGVLDISDFRSEQGSLQAISGRFALRGGIGRLARYVLPAEPAFWVSGVVKGDAELTSDASSTSAAITLDLEQPVVTTPVRGPSGRVEWPPVWSDRTVKLESRLRYQHSSDTLDLTSLHVAANGMTVDVLGSMEQPFSNAIAQLSGSVSYDWEQFSARLPDWPSGVIAKGQGTRPFTFRGPLTSITAANSASTAETSLGWTTLEAYGVVAGQGELKARLHSGVLAMQCAPFPVEQGHVAGSATLELQQPYVVRVASGRIAQGIQLSPDVCRRWMRYAAPALADATTVEGVFSADVTSGVWPLSQPQAAQFDGTLQLEQLAASPGPLVRSLIEVVGQIQRIAGREPTSGSDVRMSAAAQSVAVKVRNGRVFHDRFTVRLGDAEGLLVTTSGSVGFDDSLDLVAEVPLDPKWFRDERVARALGGQSLRVPIRGTLSRPAPDPNALQDLARRAATGAVNSFLEREVEKQVGDPLRKLIDRQRGSATPR